MITDEPNLVVIHGLEIDFEAKGANVRDTQDQFEIGLVEVFREHTKRMGGIRNLWKVAPPEFWLHVVDGATQGELRQTPQLFPFSHVLYLQSPLRLPSRLPLSLVGQSAA